MAYIVHAAEQKNLCRSATKDSVEAQIYPLGDVAVDSPVHHVWISEQFVPFASVREAVAEHYYRRRIRAEGIEQRRALIIEFTEIGSFGCKSGGAEHER